jgi:hypothetical protein
MKFCQARLSPPLIGQIVAEASIEGIEEYEADVYEEYVERRKCLVDGLNKIPGVYSPIPMGAFYTVASLPVEDADDFCAWCLSDFEYEGETVMMAPASGFYSTPGQGRNEVRIAYVLKKHVAAAHEVDPLVVPPTTHPHALRHSKAVHLVEADVNIIYIRDFMGHSSVKTTEIYAKIGSKSRSEAVEKAAANLITESAYGEEEKSAIMEWLKSLL